MSGNLGRKVLGADLPCIQCAKMVFTQLIENSFGVQKEPFIEVMLKVITTAGLLLYVHTNF